MLTDIDSSHLVFDLFFTALIYTIGPIIVRIRKKRFLDKKSAIRRATVNSIIVYIILFILYVILYNQDDLQIPKMSVAIVWSWVSYSILRIGARKFRKSFAMNYSLINNINIQSASEANSRFEKVLSISDGPVYFCDVNEGQAIRVKASKSFQIWYGGTTYSQEYPTGIYPFFPSAKGGWYIRSLDDNNPIEVIKVINNL